MNPVIGSRYIDSLTQFEGVCTSWLQEPDRQVAILGNSSGAAVFVPAARLVGVSDAPVPAATDSEPKKTVKKTPAKKAEPEPEPDTMPDFSDDAELITIDEFREGVRKIMEEAKTTDTRALRSTLADFNARTLVDVPEGERAGFLVAVRKAYEKE